MPNPVESGAEGIKGGLTRKVGPLPVWGWVVVAVSLGGVTYFLFFRDTGSSAASSLVGAGVGGGTQGGGGSGGGGGSTPPAEPITPGSSNPLTPVPVPGGGVALPPGWTFSGQAPGQAPPAASTLTNPQWLEKAVPAVVQSLGLGADRVRFYLSEYLAGGAPVGSSQASGAFQQAVQAAIQAVGSPPVTPISNPNANFFTSNATWWQNARGFLGTVPGSVVQELINLVNGSTRTISPAAAAALDAARAVVGAEPTALAYDVAEPGQPSQASVSLDQVKRLWQSGLDFLARGGTGTQLNNPAVYLPIYRASLPGLTDEQLQAVQDRIKNLIAAGAIDPKAPDWGVILSEVQRVVASGARMPVPGGAPATTGAPAAPAGPVDARMPAPVSTGYVADPSTGTYFDPVSHLHWSPATGKWA